MDKPARDALRDALTRGDAVIVLEDVLALLDVADGADALREVLRRLAVPGVLVTPEDAAVLHTCGVPLRPWREGARTPAWQVLGEGDGDEYRALAAALRGRS